jgi:hypothetical protein
MDTPIFFYEGPLPVVLPYLRAGINPLTTRKYLVLIRTSYTYFQAPSIFFKTFKKIDTPESSCERLFPLNSTFR